MVIAHNVYRTAVVKFVIVLKVNSGLLPVMIFTLTLNFSEPTASFGTEQVAKMLLERSVCILSHWAKLCVFVDIPLALSSLSKAELLIGSFANSLTFHDAALC